MRNDRSYMSNLTMKGQRNAILSLDANELEHILQKTIEGYDKQNSVGVAKLISFAAHRANYLQREMQVRMENIEMVYIKQNKFSRDQVSAIRDLENSYATMRKLLHKLCEEGNWVDKKIMKSRMNKKEFKGYKETLRAYNEAQRR